ncbi:hypothetical protein J2X69_002535 [Algoriphagus sp. 4150]|nr:hypothetical protein [Algoriphagus sp. 4150]
MGWIVSLDGAFGLNPAKARRRKGKMESEARARHCEAEAIRHRDPPEAEKRSRSKEHTHEIATSKTIPVGHWFFLAMPGKAMN